MGVAGGGGGLVGHFVSLGCHLFGGEFVLPVSFCLYDAGFHSLLVALIGKAIALISSDWRDKFARRKLTQPINELDLPVVELKPPFIF